MTFLQSQTIDELAKVIWEYHRMHQALRKADALIVLGSNDLRVAEYGAKLFLENYAPLFVVSGDEVKHKSALLDTNWGMSEAKKFAEVAIACGVPKEKILLEEKAKNTGENCIFSMQLLQSFGYSPQSLLLVQKPYMERRTYATCKQLFPACDILVSSPQLSYEEWVAKNVPKDVVISLMVGDLQRIKIYPSLGYQTYQEIPDEVWAAYEELVARGYTEHLIESNN